MILETTLLVGGLVGYLTSGGFASRTYTSIKADQEWRPLDNFTYEQLVSHYSYAIDGINPILQDFKSTLQPEYILVYGQPLLLSMDNPHYSWIRSEGEKILQNTTANNICNSGTILSWKKYFTTVEENFDKMLFVMGTKREKSSKSVPSALKLDSLEKRIKRQISNQNLGSLEHSRSCVESMKHKKEMLVEVDHSESYAWIFLVVWLQAIVFLTKGKKSLSILLIFYLLGLTVCTIRGRLLDSMPDAHKWLKGRELSDMSDAFLGALISGFVYLVRLLQAEEREERREKERQERERREEWVALDATKAYAAEAKAHAETAKVALATLAPLSASSASSKAAPSDVAPDDNFFYV